MICWLQTQKSGDNMVTEMEPVMITNILDITAEHLAYFLNRNVLTNKIPQFTANHPVSVQHDLIPRLGKYGRKRLFKKAHQW
ncbi:hypothetical protein LCGC14_2058100 [marine sediment metagenome]|uniref:Uncharacterized protein n=1 Tax=marine sediment metagenome TaxID=412755 RepID=A0A0F9HIZ3_9ZZZZ